MTREETVAEAAEFEMAGEGQVPSGHSERVGGGVFEVVNEGCGGRHGVNDNG